MVWWSSSRKWERRQIQAVFWRALRSPSLGQGGELKVPGNRLGMTSCRAPELSLRPTSSLGPGLEERWTSTPSVSLQSTNSGISRAWVSENWSPHLDSLRRQDVLYCVPGSIKDESWAECGNLALMEMPNEICFCLSRMGHFKVKVVPWDFDLSWQGKNDRK